MTTKTVVFDGDGDLTFLLSAEVKKTSTKRKRGKSQSQAPEANLPKLSMLVSSKHLSLSSKVFKTMLGPNFREGNDLRQNGKVEITLPDDNAACFEVLMAIVHAKTREVPKRVTLRFLRNMAILVDQYDLLDSVAIFANIWMNHIKLDHVGQGSINPGEVRDRLSASIVFRDQDAFRRATLLIMQLSLDMDACQRDSEPGDRPAIPQSLIDTLEDIRVERIQKCITLLNNTITKYQTDARIVATPRASIWYYNNRKHLLRYFKDSGDLHV